MGAALLHEAPDRAGSLAGPFGHSSKEIQPPFDKVLVGLGAQLSVGLEIDCHVPGLSTHRQARQQRQWPVSHSHVRTKKRQQVKPSERRLLVG